MNEKRSFQIQFDDLIQSLAFAYESTRPDVFLRGLIQNARDSTRRRAEVAAERGEPEPPAARIQIVVNPAEREIQIHDNGSGLTREEIEEHLLSIGWSIGELNRRIALTELSRPEDLIDQFGIILLSTLIVADRVSVVTKAAGHDALHLEFSRDLIYTLKPGQRKRPGTTVTLHMNTDQSLYLDRMQLESIIRTNADFIGIPVYINDDTEPVNAVMAPWRRSYRSERERNSAYHDFWERHFPNETSLHVFAADDGFSWPDTSRPTGVRKGRVRGVLSIMDRRVDDVNVRGAVDVYMNGMLVAAGSRDLLPPWARFIQGVIECNELTPTAARDNVVHDTALMAAQQALGQMILRELTDLSRLSHRRFIEIVQLHSPYLLAMSVQSEHEDFFRTIADLILLDSDKGPITLPEYLKSAPIRSSGSRLVYYITGHSLASQYFLLAAARGIHVLNCAEPFAEPFLRRYARTWPDRVSLSRLDIADSPMLFKSLTDEEAEGFARLGTAYQSVLPDLRYRVRVGRFRPTELPAVLTEPREGSKGERDMVRFAEDSAVPQLFRDLLSRFSAEESEQVTLHLNADNAIIQKLASRSDLRDEVSRQALVSLYNNALLLQARPLPVDTAQKMLVQSNRVIELLLSLAEERAQFERTLEARQVELNELNASETQADEIQEFEPRVGLDLAQSPEERKEAIAAELEILRELNERGLLSNLDIRDLRIPRELRRGDDDNDESGNAGRAGGEPPGFGKGRGTSTPPPGDGADAQHLNFWIRERELAPTRPLVIGTAYTGVFQVGEDVPANLARGARAIAPIDIPADGLDTTWIVSSTTVALIATEGGGVEEVTNEPSGDEQQWTARFRLRIPLSGNSEERVLLLIPQRAPARLDVTIYVLGDVYRKLWIDLRAGAAAISPRSASNPAPPDTRHAIRRQGFARSRSILCVPAAEVGLRTPPGCECLTLQLLPGSAYRRLERGGLEDLVPWKREQTTVQRIGQVRQALDLFRENHTAWLDSITPDDLDQALQNWHMEQGWTTLAESGGQHLGDWATMARDGWLRRIAFCGSKLFDALFPPDSAVRRSVLALDPGDRLHIVWFNDGSGNWIDHVPWALMYAQSVPAEGMPIDPEQFLGLRLRISYSSRALRERTRALGTLDRSTRAQLLYWGDGVNDVVAAEARRHGDELARFIPLVLPKTTRRKAEICRFLAQPKPTPVTLVYLYCQSQSGGGAAPVLRFGGTNAADDLVELVDIGTTKLRDQPLVFVNACQSAAADPFVVNELEESFLSRGCRAFIGTEAKVPVQFAARFARVFFNFLYQEQDGRPIAAGEALTLARRFFWTEYRSIGGLFYSYMNDYELVMSDNAPAVHP